MPITTRLCGCDERRAAEYVGAFVFRSRWQAWVFPDDPVRTMSPSAEFRAFIDRSEYDHEDHRGEPVRFVTCPFCGADLPKVALDPVTMPDPFPDDTQADGD